MLHTPLHSLQTLKCSLMHERGYNLNSALLVFTRDSRSLLKKREERNEGGKEKKKGITRDLFISCAAFHCSVLLLAVKAKSRNTQPAAVCFDLSVSVQRLLLELEAP